MPRSQQISARQTCCQRHHGFAGGAVAGVPGDRQVTRARRIVRHQTGHVIVEHRMLLDRARAVLEIPRLDQLAEGLDIGTEERGLATHQLEAVMGRRIVRAGDHDRTVCLPRHRRVVQHRRGAASDPQHAQAAGTQALD